MVDEIGNDEDFEKSDTEIETYESLQELKYPQEYEDGGIISLDELYANYNKFFHNQPALLWFIKTNKPS